MVMTGEPEVEKWVGSVRLAGDPSKGGMIRLVRPLD